MCEKISVIKHEVAQQIEKLEVDYIHHITFLENMIVDKACSLDSWSCSSIVRKYKKVYVAGKFDKEELARITLEDLFKLKLKDKAIQ